MKSNCEYRSTDVILDNGAFSDCPTDLDGWSLRVPLSSMYTFGHEVLIACQTGFYAGTFDAASFGLKIQLNVGK